MTILIKRLIFLLLLSINNEKTYNLFSNDFILYKKNTITYIKLLWCCIFTDYGYYFVGKAAIPGKSFPSKNSKDAPPPVDT